MARAFPNAQGIAPRRLVRWSSPANSLDSAFIWHRLMRGFFKGSSREGGQPAVFFLQSVAFLLPQEDGPPLGRPLGHVLWGVVPKGPRSKDVNLFRVQRPSAIFIVGGSLPAHPLGDPGAHRQLGHRRVWQQPNPHGPSTPTSASQKSGQLLRSAAKKCCKILTLYCNESTEVMFIFVIPTTNDPNF